MMKLSISAHLPLFEWGRFKEIEVMLQKWFDTSAYRPDRGLDVVRIAIGLVLMVHPIYRVVDGDVAGFGKFLSSVHFPFGAALAWFVTILSFFCSVGLIFNRMVAFSCMGHICILAFGIVLDHAADGWFVVGGGTNGMEYSVTLIAGLSAVLWSYWPRQ